MCSVGADLAPVFHKLIFKQALIRTDHHRRRTIHGKKPLDPISRTAEPRLLETFIVYLATIGKSVKVMDPASCRVHHC